MDNVQMKCCDSGYENRNKAGVNRTQIRGKGAKHGMKSTSPTTK